jgi:hypothetical protein
MSMSVSLYFLGVGIYLLWIVGDKEAFEKYYTSQILKDPYCSRLPVKVLTLASVIIFVGMSLFWPINIIKMPFQAIKNLISKDKGGE